MGRAVLIACLPWVGLLLASFVVAWVLLRLSGARLQISRLRSLHRDQEGAVQSLSFVLVLPVFIMVMLFIVQVSQLMIGTCVVHYAAFAAARSAIVWIPANVDSDFEQENCISQYVPVEGSAVTDVTSAGFGPADGGVTYVVAPGSPKYAKILSAAVLACMPISPSRDLGLGLPADGTAAAIQEAYRAMSPRSSGNQRIDPRIANKLAYAARNTTIEIHFFHSNHEPPLIPYPLVRDSRGNMIGYQANELGWQDPITVTVTHRLALLPGPGRLLARSQPAPGKTVDEVSQSIDQDDDSVYKYVLTASATLGNEGERPAIRYAQPVFGQGGFY